MKIIRSRHDSLIVRTKRSAYTLRFGEQGGWGLPDLKFNFYQQEGARLWRRSGFGQFEDLSEILDDRDGTRSTIIITSQLPTDRSHEYLGEPTVADAILDRVVHRAHRLTLGGPSRRKPDGHACR